ncbi:MAG: type II toxin-antitoxin system VapC family toxin [Thermoleophilia bacterium]
MIVLDTTVLVYAVGDDHALRDPARSLLAAAADGSLRATTTPEAIQEFAHVRARRRERADAAALAEGYADLLSPLLEVGEADLREGLRLFRRNAALGAFDAVLAAVALRAGATTLVSADRAFAGVRGLTFVDLNGLDAERLP